MTKSLFNFLFTSLLMSAAIVAVAQPANDDCANAQPVSLPSSGQACVNGNNTGASSLTWTSTTPCGQGTWTNDVWYTFVSTGPFTQVTITPTGASPATTVGLSIYTTTNCTNFQGAGGGYCNISSTPGGSATAFANLPVGSVYYVEVSTFGSAGDFQVCISSTNPPTPPGSTCATATKICNKSPFTLASVPTGGNFWPDCFDFRPQAGVWYQFTVGTPGTLAFQCDPTGTNVELDWAVYDITTGCPTTFNQTNEISCNFNFSQQNSNPIGMSTTSTTSCPTNTDPGPASGELCPAQNVIAGHTYGIFINNYTDPAPTGWDFDWNGSTFGMAPVDSFTATPDTICGNSGTVAVVNYSVGSAFQTWNFGDNTTSTAVSPPAHTYNSPGTYFITLKDSTLTGCTAVTSKSILITPNPTVTIANDTICGGIGTLTGVPSVPGGTYSWSNGPTTQSISASPLLTTTYTLTYTSPTGCTGTGTGAIVKAGNANAGADKTVSCAVLPGGSATMAGSGTGSWTALPGNPGSVTITTPTSPTTTITGYPLPGIYKFSWGTGVCIDTAQVTVTAKPNAGIDQIVSCAILPGGSATMGATGTGLWTPIAGNPGAVTITTSSNPTTTITGYPVAGVYYFAWTSGGCPDTAKVTVTAKPNAGADQTVNCVRVPGGSATMNASPATGTWTAAAGNPGTATITTPTSATTTIAGYTALGVYQYIWTSGGCPDTVAITVNGPTNAGPDQTVNCAALPGGSATMAAVGTGTWTAQSNNPGTATIVNSTLNNTAITTYSMAGIYHFIWTVAGCPDTATVTVTAKPNAGADKTVNCAILPGGSATMSATGTGTWTALTALNPGTAVITNTTLNTTTITTYSAAGIYYFTWSNAAGCLDTATVTVTAKPNGGADQSVICATLPGGTATMNATGTGTWTAIAGNAGTSVITSPALPGTTITTFSAAGTYRYAWTNGTCADTAIVTVTSQPSAGANQTANCVTLPGGSVSMAGSGTGTWSAGPGTNPGTATISPLTSPTATISGFTAAGVYNFTFANGTCTSTATVTVTAQTNAGADKTVSCAVLPGGSASMAATTTPGTWSAAAGNPGTVTILNATTQTPTITGFPLPGTYKFIYANGSCYDTAAVVVTAKPNAGTDETVDCYPVTNTTTMAATGTGTWTAQTGNPGTATIVTASSPTTIINNFSSIGTYHFIWTTGGCTDTATVIVSSRPNAGPDQTVSCAVLPDGSATMAAIGAGTWSELNTDPATATITNPNSGTTTITNYPAAGVYTFVWTVNGCTDTAKVTVTAKPDAGADQTACQYTSATATAVGTGVWSAQTNNPSNSTIATPSSATTTISGLSLPGAYHYIWTSGGCKDTMTVNVTAKPNAGNDQTICQYTGTSLAATGTGTWSDLPGNPATTITNNPSDPTTAVTGYTQPGAYGYVWTVNGCTDTVIINVTGKPDAGQDLNICQNATAGMSGAGTGTWSALSTNPTTTTIANAAQSNTAINGLSSVGVYSFIWTVGGCTDTVDVYVNTQPTVSVRDTAICAGNSATLTANPSISGGSFLWSTNDPNQSITVTPGTTTTYTVTYSLGICSAQATGRVTVNQLPVVTVATANSVCTANNGSAWAVITGTGPYTYIWSRAGATDTINSLSPGTYDVTVTDNIGCIGTASGVVGQSSPGLTITLVNQRNLGCNGDNSGSISISSTGTGTLTYTWNPTGNSPTISNLSAQTYAVTVTDQNGCIGSASYTVTEPAVLSVAMTYTDPICPGSSDGTATGTPAGGSGTYQYEWDSSPQQFTQTATGLPEGTYNLTVTDGGGCTATGSVDLIDPNGTTFGSGSITDTKCHGSSDGTATVYPQGGFGPYAYIWNDPAHQVNAQATGLAAGQYTVTVTDSRGCTVSTNVLIGQPDTLIAQVTGTDLTCYQNASGTATASVRGGTLQYSYRWSNGNQTITTTNLRATTYTVSVTDGLGCVATASITLTEPTPVQLTRTSLSTNCFSTTDGSISAAGSGGGGGPYSYSLKDITGNTIQNSTTGTFTGLGAQIYTVVVTDQNGCSSTDTITVPRAAFNVYNVTTDSTSCFGPEYKDGKIHLEGLTIPNGPFLYSVDGSQAQDIPNFFDLGAGPHNVTVKDAHGCDTSFIVIVGEPIPASVDILPGDTTIEPGTSIQMTTAFRPYSTSSITGYAWSPASGLSCVDCPSPVASPYGVQNTYTVTVTYNKGCLAVTTVHIKSAGDPPFFMPNAFSPNGDGENDVLYAYGEGIKTLKLTIFNRWGEKVFESNNQSQGWDGTYKGTLQEPGIYPFIVDLTYLNEHKRLKSGSITMIR